MKFTVLLFIACFWFPSVFGQQNDAALKAGFDKLLTEDFKPGEPGATALVARKGQIIYHKAFGMANLEFNIPMQVDNIFRIGSITKQFTAIAILQLMEQGKLSLQDDITKFIPDYPTHGHTITIEHLLTHTSGIQSYTGMKDFEEKISLDLNPTQVIDFFKNQPMEFAPGTQWHYNNSGYFLLGYIIEKASGKSYPDYIETQFFKPLGMTNSLYGSDKKIIKNRAGAYDEDDSLGIVNAHVMSMTIPYAAGSIQSTVGDLFKWHQALHGGKLVKKETLEKAFKPVKLTDGTSHPYGYGFGFQNVQGSPTIEHGGGINGFLTHSMYLPKEDVFVAVFSNCMCHSPADVTAKMAALTIGKPYEPKEIKVEPLVLQGYTGVYENSKGEQRYITVENNQLHSERQGSEKLKLKASAKDQFFFEARMNSLVFSRDASGAVDKVTLKGREDDMVWTKTNKPMPSRIEMKVDEEILSTYVGSYELAPNFILTITKEGDRIFAQATGQGKNELFAKSPTQFFLKVVDAEVEFVKDETGKVSKLILNQGKKMEAKRVR
ncbi:MAG TPA: serine hydrolase [Catalimonadaceae bacterium]|nr:serine hydrolase [Catalimonadaceae bacterium]